MLSNHSISIRSVYKLIFLIIVLSGCAQVRPINSGDTSGIISSGPCQFAPKSVEQKHLVTAAKIKSTDLTSCFKNYLRFEENKKQLISTCNQLSVRKTGKVSYVQVTDANGKNLPKDFKMCVMQEYWKMDFAGLQLDQSHVIKFQLNFSSL